MRDNMRFPVPEGRKNWCLVYAFAHAAGYDTLAAVERLAREAARMTVGVLSFVTHLPLFHRPAFNLWDGMGHVGGIEGARKWAALIGKAVVDHQHHHQSESPTVAAFARAHPTGTHLVAFGTSFASVGGRNFARGRHILCIVDGVIYGQYINTRKRVVESFTLIDLFDQETQL